MISRSVPLYQEVGHTSVALAAKFAQANSNIYDLGCSTGTTLIALSEVIQDTSVKLVGLDSSEAMISEFRNRLVSDSHKDIRISCEDILTNQYIDASVIIGNYTLQFLPVSTRASLSKKIADSLKPGGLFILSEKIKHPHDKLHRILTELHHDFKRANGYSDLEIAQKRDSIENVLVPITIEENIQMLKESGFDIVYPVLTWYTFVTLAAIKL
ncbi:UNVERIFIED_CONTAM: hypothetical protein GTU68_066940 [Idotea baltica]|nr:hypothetical protein [Idotea baltica]